MMRKQIKHIPQRTCIGCRKVLEKRSLIRIVRTPDGIKIDPSGKIAGRGAYLHNQRSCWEKGIKGALVHALKVELTDKDKEYLLSYLDNIPEGIEEEADPTS
jgi:predicted RNA-binding protein YlxR (DUF448 family)